MSMLLEALKKSEQQRRLGAAPTLQTPVDDTAVEDDSLQHWLPLVLMAVSVIAIAWFGWQQYRPPESAAARSLPARPPAEEREALKTPAAEASSVTPAEATAPVSAPQSASSGQARTPVETFRAADSAADTQPPPEEQVSSGPEPAPPGQFEEQARAVAGTEPPEPAGSTDAAPRKQAEPHESAPISYWELPQTIRDDLPEFRITVLVYADQPADRFLLMGGQRLIEGETVDGGLVLEEIRREGAVFRYRKYRFLVKR